MNEKWIITKIGAELINGEIRVKCHEK